MKTFKRCLGCSVIALFFCFVTPCHGMDITLAWDANTEPNLAGYKVYYDSDGSGEPYGGIGATEGDSPIDVGNVTEFTLYGLLDGEVHFFAVTAYNDEGLESDYSNEVSTRGSADRPGDVGVDSGCFIGAAWSCLPDWNTR